MFGLETSKLTDYQKDIVSSLSGLADRERRLLLQIRNAAWSTARPANGAVYDAPNSYLSIYADLLRVRSDIYRQLLRAEACGLANNQFVTMGLEEYRSDLTDYDLKYMSLKYMPSDIGIYLPKSNPSSKRGA